MPNTDDGRQKILDYLKENNLSMTTLAVQYGMVRQDVTNILNGKLRNPQAHRFIARVIEDFKIRQEVVVEEEKTVIKNKNASITLDADGKIIIDAEKIVVREVGL